MSEILAKGKHLECIVERLQLKCLWRFGKFVYPHPDCPLGYLDSHSQFGNVHLTYRKLIWFNPRLSLSRLAGLVKLDHIAGMSVSIGSAVGRHPRGLPSA